MPKDSQYLNSEFHLSERSHRYGKNVHLIQNPFYEQMLSNFSTEQVIQPQANRIVSELSHFLVTQAVNFIFPRRRQKITTRMRKYHTEAEYEVDLVDTQSSAVVVDLMRAGILPSQVCFETLHSVLPSTQIRQDHILLNRVTDSHGKVSGVQMSGYKIGGTSEKAFVFIPDPMGATGATFSAVMDLYKEKYGVPRKFIAIHFIVTPEYLKKMQPRSSEVEIFALRLDRGLSSQEVLDSGLGEFWNEERGLNENDYIVPGAGGIGEILNNSLV